LAAKRFTSIGGESVPAAAKPLSLYPAPLTAGRESDRAVQRYTTVNARHRTRAADALARSSCWRQRSATHLKLSSSLAQAIGLPLVAVSKPWRYGCSE